MNEQSPWGGGSGNGSGDGGDGGGRPRNPWTRPPGGDDPSGGDPRGPSALEELLRRVRDALGGGLPGGAPGRGIWVYGLLAIVVLWIGISSFHRVGPQERGVVTFLGRYSRILPPGIGLTLPYPFESVETMDVEEIRTLDIGSSGDSENLMLTRDQNLIDLAYSVRWNIRRPEEFAFQIADAGDQTIREVAESAMRAVIATVNLNEALGEGRSAIEDQVRQRTQEILDSYRAGVEIQGVAIKQADPPNAVNDAFKDVSAAQQDADAYLTEAHTYAEQQLARAQGDAAAFDRVYAQYKLAPEVTRRRMYYETMEQVLSGVDKTIVEAPGVTPYLPLPEIARRKEVPATGSTSGSTGSTGPNITVNGSSGQ